MSTELDPPKSARLAEDPGSRLRAVVPAAGVLVFILLMSGVMDERDSLQWIMRRWVSGTNLLWLFGLSLGWVAALPLAAATYYLDPVTGAASNPGTSLAPWGALQEVAASGRRFVGGDELVLRAGHHGSPVVRGTNAAEVLVRAETGARVTLKSLTVRSAERWRFRGLEISPATAPSFERVTLVSLAADSSEVTLEGCRLYTVEDSSGWTASDWDTRACSAISVSGPGNVVRSNALRNINFGITVTGPSNLVSHNVIENFSGDGLRGLGDYGVFEYNVVRNCYAVNANHDDGFQSWSVGPGGVGTGVVRGVVLRGNRIVNYADPAQPHRGTLQGIGCFDGFFEDWVIENNEILTDHWHGITLLGARNCRIVNNTVVDLNTNSPGPPWISIGNHKDGTASTGNVVRNNLATDLQVTAGSATVDHNLEIDGYARYFRNYPAGDLRLKAGSPAIDAGSPEGAPVRDAEGLPRPLDGNADGTGACDLGAREYAHDAVDADADGMSDSAEATAGTSPMDPLQVLRVAASRTPAGIRLSWPGTEGRRYGLVIRRQFGAEAWEAEAGHDESPAPDGRVTLEVVPVHAVGFFRAVVTSE